MQWKALLTIHSDSSTFLNHHHSCRSFSTSSLLTAGKNNLFLKNCGIPSITAISNQQKGHSGGITFQITREGILDKPKDIIEELEKMYLTGKLRLDSLLILPQMSLEQKRKLLDNPQDCPYCPSVFSHDSNREYLLKQWRRFDLMFKCGLSDAIIVRPEDQQFFMGKKEREGFDGEQYLFLDMMHDTPSEVRKALWKGYKALTSPIQEDPHHTETKPNEPHLSKKTKSYGEDLRSRENYEHYWKGIKPSSRPDFLIDQMDYSTLDVVKQIDDYLLLRWCRYFKIDFQLRNVKSVHKNCEIALTEFLEGVLIFKDGTPFEEREEKTRERMRQSLLSKEKKIDTFGKHLSLRNYKSFPLGFFTAPHNKEKEKKQDLPIWWKMQEEVGHLMDKESHMKLRGKYYKHAVLLCWISRVKSLEEKNISEIKKLLIEKEEKEFERLLEKSGVQVADVEETLHQ